MPNLPVKAIATHVKTFTAVLAKQIGAAFSAPAGQETLPTRAQLLKMGPQNDYTRDTSHLKGW